MLTHYVSEIVDEEWYDEGQYMEDRYSVVSPGKRTIDNGFKFRSVGIENMYTQKECCCDRSAGPKMT
jgi:hypothetical protein